jgi:hypothetical protein
MCHSNESPRADKFKETAYNEAEGMAPGVRHCSLIARLILLPLPAFVLLGQNPAPDQPPAASQEPAATHEHQRIFGVLPNFLTISSPNQNVQPLTAGQKFALVARQTYDPVTILSAAAGAGLSQIGDHDPKYGVGGAAYAQRFGAAMADLSSQSFFSGALLASVLHEDPRYFRKGPEYGFCNRVVYALSRVVVTRTDAGGRSFNFAGVTGMAMGIALSNAYYPPASVSGREVAQRVEGDLVWGAVSNILPEFWPDIREKFFRRKPGGAKPSPTQKAPD